jgi:hypothetical protein
MENIAAMMSLPLIVLLATASIISTAFGLMVFRKRVTAPAV